MLEPYTDVVSVHFRDRSPENPFYHHMPPCEAKEIFEQRGWDFGDYVKFTLVRNPWARLVSTYEAFYTPRTLREKVGYPIRKLLGMQPSFKQWLKKIRPDGEGAGYAANKRYRRYVTYSIYNYVSDEAGNILVDKIIRLEDMEFALPELFSEIGLPKNSIQIVHRNVGKHKPYREYYDDEDIELVKKKYAYDISQFDYRF